MCGEDQKRGRTWSETIEVAGNKLLSRVKELVAEGNVRRLVIRKPNGDLLVEVPLTAGVVVVGAFGIIYPFLAALLAVAVLMVKVKVEIVRSDGGPEQ